MIESIDFKFLFEYMLGPAIILIMAIWVIKRVLGDAKEVDSKNEGKYEITDEGVTREVEVDDSYKIHKAKHL